MDRNVFVRRNIAGAPTSGAALARLAAHDAHGEIIAGLEAAGLSPG